PIEQQAHDGNVYVYYHMQAIVHNDGSNNGTYWLIDIANPTLPASWELIGSGGVAETKASETFTITSTDITNGYIDLANTPNNTYGTDVRNNGLSLPNTIDWTLTTNRITFVIHSQNIITAGDIVEVKYSY
ncbi:MAG: hypothetical protein U9O94_09810, partial [Nanoarchaeota archaeon]|nr:hypothetical protein [Nanoarchaeota archaeon]